MRERVEDLGRIAVMVKNLLHEELFENRHCRNKDYSEWFEEQTEDKRDDILRAWVYGLDSLQEKLCEVLEVAEGTDFLNTPEGEIR